jgi:predicted alpha-1,2-mannosidase
MNLKRTFIVALLGSTILAGCNGSDNKSPASSNGVSQSTFDDLKSTTQKSIDGLKNTLVEPRLELRREKVGSTALRTDSAALKADLIELKAQPSGNRKKALGELQLIGGELRPIGVRSSKNDMAFKIIAMQLEKLQSSLDSAAGPTNSDEDKAEIAALSNRIKKLQGEVSVASKVRAARQKDPSFLDKVKSFTDHLKTAKTSLADTDIKTLKAAVEELKAEFEVGLASDEQTVSLIDTQVASLQSTIADIKGIRIDLPLANYVNTTRGSTGHTESRDGIARGNTFPATAMPFGFNMWTPVNAKDTNWFYNSSSKTMRAFAVTHEASGHNGNRQSLQIIPAIAEKGTTKREQTFQRKNEIARAHYYSVTFDNQLKTEITPTDHAAYFRFTAPDTKEKIKLFFDDFTSGGSLTINEVDGTVSGYTLHDAHKYTPRMYFFAKFDQKIAKSAKTTGFGAWLEFDTPAANKLVGLKIATSFISVEQAKDNLEQEIANKSFDDVLALAEAAWNEKLNTIKVEGASEDQKIILYSNMYRSFLYPNSAWENVRGADGKYVPTYVSPYIAQEPVGEISNKLKRGKIWVNNGFWDTYRTTWPLYTLLFPNQAGEMIDGFVNGFKDGGWTTRWSNPGYTDSMVGTSSDIIIADMYMKGVRNFDVDAAYNSIVRNASTVSGKKDRGRKGMHRSMYYGYMSTGTGSQAVSWSLEGAVNDFGLAQMAKALNRPDDLAYYTNRAITYANLFSLEKSGTWKGGWFRAKNGKGAWDDSGGTSYWRNVTPITWGGGYTEGNAWSYAFLAPQDGQGLANLYGGRDKLKAKLDTFFTTAPSGTSDSGSYRDEIHEMKEAREAARLANVGQYQHSNQPVHHSIYMYNYAGAPASGQKYLRDVMDKLYFTGFDKNGVSNGEGYIGDEDNGEQSAWYILSAMGIYPVSMGRPEYAIGAPYFPRMSVRMKTIKNGEKTLTIRAPGVSSTNRYVQSVKLNGKPVFRNYLLHSEIADGATLDFVMGPNPSQWGTGVDDVPTSITKGDAKPKPLVSLLRTGAYDRTGSNKTSFDKLFDADSGTVWNSGSNGWVEASIKNAKPAGTARMYTLTSIDTNVGSPKSWTLKASNDDGTTWKVLDQRKDQTFSWGQQLRPFALKRAGAYKRYRIEFDGTTPVNLAEFELLGEVQ